MLKILCAFLVFESFTFVAGYVDYFDFDEEERDYYDDYYETSRNEYGNQVKRYDVISPVPKILSPGDIREVKGIVNRLLAGIEPEKQDFFFTPYSTIENTVYRTLNPEINKITSIGSTFNYRTKTFKLLEYKLTTEDRFRKKNIKFIPRKTSSKSKRSKHEIIDAFVDVEDKINLRQGTPPDVTTTSIIKTTSKETIPIETTSKESTPIETTSKETTPIEITSKVTTLIETTTKQATPMETTSKETTPIETTTKQATPMETTSKETTPIETTSKETTLIETTSKETTPKETTTREIPLKETTTTTMIKTIITTTPNDSAATIIETTSKETTTTTKTIETETTDPETATTETIQKDETTLVTTTEANPKKSNLDMPRLLSIIEDLASEFETNLTRKLNETLFNMSIPTCTTPTTIAPTTSDYDANYTGVTIAKCFVCGLDIPGIPHHAHCADAFAGDFLPLVPVDPTAKARISSYRKYCKYSNTRGYTFNASHPRAIYGRWTGGCAVRWIDLSGIYTQRTCRNRLQPSLGKHFASKRMAKLERSLWNIENGCITSPMATLVPLSRGISLYARFHACVCTGNWCNIAIVNQPWILYNLIILVRQ